MATYADRCKIKNNNIPMADICKIQVIRMPVVCVIVMYELGIVRSNRNFAVLHMIFIIL